MKKSKITGWQDVFSFTLIQTLKSKTFIISFVIMLALVFISMPIINLIKGGGDRTETVSPITKVYVDNQTTLPPMDFAELKKDEALSHIIFEEMQEDYNTVSKRIEAEETSSVILTFLEDSGIFSISLTKASEGPVKDGSLSYLGDAILTQFDLFKIQTLGITPEQEQMLDAPVETFVTMVDVTGNPILEEDTSITMTEYWFVYGILFVILMTNVLGSTQIATSIVTEKSTRVIENLLISVKPMALMIGKILATLLAVVLQIVTLVIAVFISNSITAKFFSNSGNDIISTYLPKNIFQNINILNLLICLVAIALGLIFYAMLASMAGATVSKIDELSEGLTLFTFISGIGAYIAVGAANVLLNSGENAFVTFSFLFPLSSPFLLPGAILIGKASIGLIAIAIGLQLLFIVLLIILVSKVFETLILHNGAKIKITDLFKISKTA